MEKLQVVLFSLLIFTSTSLSAQDGPGARWGHVLVSDQANDNVLLFGGAKERGTYIGDTWIWDESGWKQVESESPQARGFAVASFHEGRKTIILHGGRGNENVTFSDTWEWDGEKWNVLENQGPYKADHHAMVYSSADDKLIAFGGWNGESVLGETWSWDGEWSKLGIASPPPRSAFGMAYNKSENKIQLFGGLWINGQYADVWEFSQNNWTSPGGPYDNSSLDHHSMIYDSNLKKVVLFGGKNYRYRMQNKTLTISGSQVTAIAETGPSVRHSIGLTYDNKNGLGYLYGGKEYVNNEQLPLGDFWKWDGSKWEKIN